MRDNPGAAAPIDAPCFVRGRSRNPINPDLILELERCLILAAKVVEKDIEGLPIFERIDAELSAARATISLRSIDDPITKARELSRLKKGLA